MSERQNFSSFLPVTNGSFPGEAGHKNCSD